MAASAEYQTQAKAETTKRLLAQLVNEELVTLHLFFCAASQRLKGRIADAGDTTRWIEVSLASDINAAPAQLLWRPDDFEVPVILKRVDIKELQEDDPGAIFQFIALRFDCDEGTKEAITLELSNSAAMLGVVDGKREDSSDQTSGVLSLENLRENENEGVDWGDASNTTPAKSASPRIAEAVAETGPDAEMVDAPPADESGHMMCSTSASNKDPIPFSYNCNDVGMGFNSHAYTSGRWLRHDKEERASRYISFDFQALCHKILELSPGASTITRCQKLKGGFNRVFIFELNNNKRMVVRLPFTLAGPALLTTSSKITTIRYFNGSLLLLVQIKTTIPIPKIFDWNCDATSIDNTIGSEYIIMEHAAGIQFHRKWQEMAGDQRVRCIDAIYQKAKEMADLQFPSFRSLYLADSPETISQNTATASFMLVSQDYLLWTPM
ncbi:uncharacterized protein ASPGLDRAFT_82375 [Aspergillus glaucus CBS 516.65]|uniref:Altered inheritance of mitochondria protein 9, mitochondrial n=1 Tax=Aspergillus glaucus CBS 516.65 TaxID=1160497 RepID=A0A1L9VKK5_ASPGL|nr:hypothetical protein ASPGLDRAFT_82375 [Aspergillus glaucus CBS 516.65]OJJ84410.1 hypothetical protein ASPGLDRAFT_82375 [Aspergillus glaucus CBS 516.65]